MIYQIEWSETALERLTEQFDFIARRNPSAAADLINELFDRTKVLCEHPRAGQVFPGSANSNLREMVFGKHRVIYRVDDARARVFIVMVQHGRERPMTKREVENLEE